MHCIVGLGNPGREYAGCRHNVGFQVIDLLAERHGVSLGRRRLRSVHGRGTIDSEPVLLVQPQTFMNNSGDAVRRLTSFYDVGSAEDLLVVYDDISIDLGVIRLRRGGSDGGHRGLRSVIAYCGTQEIPRLRLGVGSPPEGVSAIDYVLAPFKASERKPVEEMVATAAEAVEYWLAEGIEAAMNRYNG